LRGIRPRKATALSNDFHNETKRILMPLIETNLKTKEHNYCLPKALKRHIRKTNCAY
jgi:hypothetical protein